MGRKVGAHQLPTFRPMSIVYVYVGFWTDHSRIETRVDENQLVRVETNNQVVRLCPIIPITGFSVSLASDHCVIALQRSTEHFTSTGSTRAICTRTLNLHYYHTRVLGDSLYKSTDRLATICMGRKWGGAAVGAGSPLGPHLTQCGLGRGLLLYQVAS